MVAETLMGIVSLSIFTSLSGPPIYIPTHNEFQWTSYEDPAIRAIIPDEYFQNPNAWHVKVALVNYATISMAPEVLDDHHKIDLRGEAAAITCPKGTTWPFKSKKKRQQCKLINEAQTITRPIINTHTITKLNNSTDTVTEPTVQLTIPTTQPFQMMP
ncbi:hypothetical protein Goshw_007943, partial [Gossypium schwendimanii]|nr:hypothetical protein [Gossypium schwendimanii]